MRDMESGMVCRMAIRNTFVDLECCKDDSDTWETKSCDGCLESARLLLLVLMRRLGAIVIMTVISRTAFVILRNGSTSLVMTVTLRTVAASTENRILFLIMKAILRTNILGSDFEDEYPDHESALKD